MPIQQGPTPWWQLPGPSMPGAPGSGGGPGTLANLQKSAPIGYTYDPVQMKYIKTPEAKGEEAGRAVRGLQSQLPGMFGIAASPGAYVGMGEGGGSYGGYSGYGGMMPGVQQISVSGGGGASSGRVAPIQAPDFSAAQSAAFARAKDQVGLEAQGALTGLRSALGGRGLLGSGAEYQGTQNVITRGMGELGDVSREQAIQGAGAQERAASLGYTGGIQQRGQDIQSQQAQAGLQAQIAEANQRAMLTGRGQDIGMMESQQRMALERQRMQQEQMNRILSGLNISF